MSKTIDVEVLVVGAGLAGSTMSVLLARHGIQALTIDREAWVLNSPRAHIVNQRTMEIMRSLDLAEKCRSASTPGELMANLVMVSPSLAGREFGRIWAWGNDPARLGDYATASPERTCDLPQNRFEPILLAEAAQRGAIIRHRTKLVSLAQDDTGVTCIAQDLVTGEEFEIRAAYVVGADGANSSIAKAIGLPMEGEHNLAPAVNIHFEADLAQYVAHRPGDLYWVFQPGRQDGVGTGQLRMVRPWNEWIAAFAHLTGGGAEMNSEEGAVATIRELVGDDSLTVKVLGIYPWRINHVVAGRYGEKRVQCIGDAVHRHPPSNALGGNTCIQDAFNLAWKLAAVLRWGAGEDLLNTLTQERQPIGRRIVDRAVATWRRNGTIAEALGVDPLGGPADRQKQFDQLFETGIAGERRRQLWSADLLDRKYGYDAHGIEMNQVYKSDAVEDTPDAPKPIRDEELYFSASTRPGARLPHCWVTQRGETLSLLDLARSEQFTLLARPRGGEWLRAAEELAVDLPFELKAYRVGMGCEVEDPYNAWADLSDLDETGCVLVRPDQHISWRWRTQPTSPKAALSAALQHSLARRP